MQDAAPEHYLLRHQHRLPWLFWPLFLGLSCAANIRVVQLDLARSGAAVAAWEPLVWESSSALLILLLVPLVVLFDRHCVRHRLHWSSAAIAHSLAALLFCLLHVLGMVALRHLAYGLAERSYDFGHWPSELFYEFLKDFRSYWLIIALIYLYRFLILRLQGEASNISEGEPDAAAAPATERFLVKKLGREFLIRAEQIDWIEAAGNYVSLHLGNTHYLLRDTMTHLASQLQVRGFMRVHRSAILNLERLESLQVDETGDAVARLHSGAEIAVSRRHLAALRERLAAGSA